MPSRLYDIAAGEELGPGAICQHNGKVPCELRRLPSGNLPLVELDRDVYKRQEEYKKGIAIREVC